MEHPTEEKEEVSEVEELCLPKDENWRFMLGKVILEQRKKS